MDYHSEWPEPEVRVQSLSESGVTVIPDRFIKAPSERPSDDTAAIIPNGADFEMPVIDLGAATAETVVAVTSACREWGFFQAVNHGVSPDLLRRSREAWSGFFNLPMEAKQAYANSPRTYEGYGSRLGVEKNAILDWGDNFFLHYMPLSLKDHHKWPALPVSLRETVEEYGKELVKLCERVMGLLSAGLGLDEGRLQSAFGGENVGVCMRVNYYPKCPQPELTLGLSAHSDPGGITVLLPDDRVLGLQVRRHGGWLSVQPLPDAFIINVGDQLQVVTNAEYRSVEHRAVVNSTAERMSMAFFYNPRGDLPLGPLKELVGPHQPALYKRMTYDEYRLDIRRRGPRGKSQVESLRTSSP